MTRYAANTSVSVEKSQADVKATLMRYGADQFGVLENRSSAAVLFEIRGITVRITVPLPSPTEKRFTISDAGRKRSEKAAWSAYEQATRQVWRALLLAIKAKLEAVEAGISTLETEFMPFMVMPNNQTVGEHLLPRLEEAVKQGQMPKLLALPGPEVK